MIRSSFAALLVTLLLFSAGCSTAPDNVTPPEPDVATASAAAPLPLRTTLKGIMIGVIDLSSRGVFQAAASKNLMTDFDWYAASVSAINLIGSSTLISMPGTGKEDAAWVADPRWREQALALQQSSVESAVAISRNDRVALLLAADRVADACQSCHDVFRPELPKIEVTKLASLR